jgi:hypothetical protein
MKDRVTKEPINFFLTNILTYCTQEEIEELTAKLVRRTNRFMPKSECETKLTEYNEINEKLSNENTNFNLKINQLKEQDYTLLQNFAEKIGLRFTNKYNFSNMPDASIDDYKLAFFDNENKLVASGKDKAELLLDLISEAKAENERQKIFIDDVEITKNKLLNLIGKLNEELAQSKLENEKLFDELANFTTELSLTKHELSQVRQSERTLICELLGEKIKESSDDATIYGYQIAQIFISSMNTPTTQESCEPVLVEIEPISISCHTCYYYQFYDHETYSDKCPRNTEDGRLLCCIANDDGKKYNYQKKEK